MKKLTNAQKGRVAIRTFKTIADALALRGHYRPSGKTGQTLEQSLRDLKPEIYGTMNDPRSVELNGLEYVIERLPRGIEECNRIIVTAQEDFENTAFEKIEPPKRRRTSYRMSDNEICFIISRGESEVYDLLTHLTFLNIEANKIYDQIKDANSELYLMWRQLAEDCNTYGKMSDKNLDRALWNLSIILGRTYQETKKAFLSLEKSKKKHSSNAGLFHVIYHLGRRVEKGKENAENELTIYFTPTFQSMIGFHNVSRDWARSIKQKLAELHLRERPLHIISANMHSVKNIIYGLAAKNQNHENKSKEDIYKLIAKIRDNSEQINEFAKKHGLTEVTDCSGANIDFQIIDTACLSDITLHPDLKIKQTTVQKERPVLLVMDYAFGTQAFEVMDELLNPSEDGDELEILNLSSISIMGKAGILPGKKGDIMLATAHVLEGTPHNYLVDNDLKVSDFDTSIDVYEGLIVTVLGTSLQNRDVLERFQKTSWNAVGLEMEGGHYQRAINAAIIKGHISREIKTRYAYYASDNPLRSGQTLASGSMGKDGIRPTYMITKVVLEKILN